jgi:hypothetical protein
MNSTLFLADRSTHTKIVATGLLVAIIFGWAAMAAHSATGQISPSDRIAVSPAITVDRSAKGDRLNAVTITKAAVGCDRAVSPLVPHGPSNLVVSCLT